MREHIQPLNLGQPDDKDNEISLFKNIPGIQEEKNYNEILNQCNVAVSDIIPVPPVCIQIINNSIRHTFGTLGNFSLLIGKAKAGKTFALSLILAAAVKNDQVLQDSIKVVLPENQKNILYFDTEQSRYHVHKVLKRICALANEPEPKNLFVYSLRGLSPAERLKTIEFAIENFSNVGLVVIDGIRDLVTSINDEEQSTTITTYLLQWTERYNIHGITVLHQNKGDLNARGHLGTELTNKSETVISVSKGENKTMSIIAPEYCRDQEFNPIAFVIDENGLPNIIEHVVVPNTADKKKKLSPDDVPTDSHDVILKDVFSTQKEMLRSELVRSARGTISRHLSYSIGQNKTDDWIVYWLHFGFIITKGKAGTKACKYSINDD